MLLNLLVNILIIITNLTTVSEIKKKTEKKKFSLSMVEIWRYRGMGRK